MAREVKKGIKKFDLDRSDVVQENERILEQGPLKHNPEQQAAEQPQPSATETANETAKPTPTEQLSADKESQAQQEQDREEQPPVEEPLPHTETSHKPSRRYSSSPLKTEKGVKIMLPMDYYFKLVRLKEYSGKTLQELATQGVMDFLDKYVKD